jgi:hypothetical protein
MGDHKRPLMLAAAAWAQLSGLTQAYQAAVLRGDQDGAEAIRNQAHAVLDSNLDLNGEAAMAVRAIIGG